MLLFNKIIFNEKFKKIDKKDKKKRILFSNIFILILLTIFFLRLSYSLDISYVNFNNPEYVLLSYKINNLYTQININKSSSIKTNSTNSTLFLKNLNNKSLINVKLKLLYLKDNKNKIYKLNKINLNKNNSLNNKSLHENQSRSLYYEKEIKNYINKTNYILIINKKFLRNINNDF